MCSIARGVVELVLFIQQLQTNQKVNVEVHVDICNTRKCTKKLNSSKQARRHFFCIFIENHFCNFFFRYSLQDFRSSIGGGSAAKYKRVVISEYGACTKKACGYEFCTNCYHGRHLNAKCTRRPLGSSPKSDDDTPHRCETRNTKRNLKRLGRLAF